MKVYQKLMTAMAAAFPALVVGSFLLAIGNLDLFGTYNQEILKVGSILLLIGLPMFGGTLVSNETTNRIFVYGAMIGILSNLYKTGMIGTLVGCFITVRLYRFLSNHTFIKSLGALAVTVAYPLILGLVNAVVFGFIIAPPTRWLMNIMMQGIMVNNTMIQMMFGLIFGILMILDLGGPINKTNAFILNALYLEGYTIGAAIKMTGGMVAPVGIGLAKVILGDKKGYKTMIQGASFITESLIIHSMDDAQKIKIASIIGTGVTCGLIGYYQIYSYTIQGGLIMAFTFSNPLIYLGIFGGGTLLTCLLYLGLTKMNT